ncbi:MAG: nitrous oxide reductase accessory protein NosL [Conchiformibius sp.]|nr:nitrous oxide reductase accessory protein NosL [Conchiformibius sp.]
MKPVWVLILSAVIGLQAACGGRENTPPPPPQAVGAESVGHYCTMNLNEHKGPKGQVFHYSDPSKPVWFSTVNQVFGYLRHPGEPRDVSAVYVSDMGKVSDWQQADAGNHWLDAHHAFYVIESPFVGGMGAPDALPFAQRAQAQAFADKNGGRVVTFDEMPDSFIYR